MSFCNFQAAPLTASVKVELLVNGNPVDGRSFVRTHPRTSGDVITITGQAKCILREGDTIQVRVTPQGGAGAKQYKAKGDMSSITVERMRNFQ